MLFGDIIAWLFLAYPSELLRPGWLSWKNAITRLLPVIFIGVVDFFVPWDLRWLLAVVPIVWIILLFRHVRSYRKYCEDNFSSMEKTDERWVIRYLLMMLILGASYAVLCFIETPTRLFTQQWLILYILVYTNDQVMFRSKPWLEKVESTEPSEEVEEPVSERTEVVPEAIYVIGGVDSRPEDHHYGQEGYFDMFTGTAYGDPSRDVDVRIKLPSGDTTSYTINAAPLDTIRLRDDHHRPMRDNNLNSVIEPWELERQTILSGNAVAGEDFTHVYHVITMHADSNYVGPQPLKFLHMNPEFNKNNLRPGIPMLIDPIPMNKPDQFVDELTSLSSAVPRSLMESRSPAVMPTT